MFWMKPAVYHIRYGYIIIPQNNTLACSSETPDWRVLLTRRVFYHCFNTFSVCCNDFLTCCWVLVACCLNLVCCYNTLRRVLLEKQHTSVSWLQKAKFLEHVSVSYKHVCVLKQHANNTSMFLVCLPLNFPLAYHMHAGNLEDKVEIFLLHEQWGKYEVYIPSVNKRIFFFLIYFNQYFCHIFSQHLFLRLLKIFN